MTEDHAIDLSIEVWGYLSEHPELQEKSDIPPDLYKQIKKMEYECPMCEVHPKCPVITEYGLDIDCPLFPCTNKAYVSGPECKYPNAYSDFAFSNSKEAGKVQRKLAAQHIVEMLQDAKSKNKGK